MTDNGDKESTEALSIASSILPALQGDNKKSQYLTYRIAGFSVREALKMAKVTERTLFRWKADDPEFKDLDGGGLNNVRNKLSVEYVNLEFTRNFHLVMQKDFNILIKSLTEPTAMSEEDEKYLIKMRSHYTPQQLALIKQMLGIGGGDGAPETFNWSKFTLTITAEQKTPIER